MDYIVNVKEIKLYGKLIVNRDEILNRYEESEILFFLNNFKLV